MFGSLPRTWIELGLGVDPDGGNGLFEFLLAALPIAVGLGLAIHRVARYRNRTLQATETVNRGRESPRPAADPSYQARRLHT
jgi:hypothetical protein